MGRYYFEVGGSALFPRAFGPRPALDFGTRRQKVPGGGADPHRASPVPAENEFREGEAWVKFFQPVQAVTRGQVAVFYQGEEVLGGGIIVKSFC